MSNYEDEEQQETELNFDHWSSLQGYRLHHFEEAVERFTAENVYCKFPLSIDELSEQCRLEILSKFCDTNNRNRISENLTLMLISEHFALQIMSFLDECAESLYQFNSGACILAYRTGQLNEIISQTVYASGSF